MRAGRFPIDAAEPFLPNHGALAADDDRGAREAAGANPPLHDAINDAQARCRHADGSRCFDRQSSVSSSYGEGSEQRKHHGGPLLPKRPTEPRPETRRIQDSELGVVPRGSAKATAFNCRKNEGSNSERLCEPENWRASIRWNDHTT